MFSIDIWNRVKAVFFNSVSRWIVLELILGHPAGIKRICWCVEKLPHIWWPEVSAVMFCVKGGTQERNSREALGVSCIKGKWVLFLKRSIKSNLHYTCRRITEIQQVWFQTTAIKWMLQWRESPGGSAFPVCMEVMFTLWCGLLSVQQHYIFFKCTCLN